MGKGGVHVLNQHPGAVCCCRYLALGWYTNARDARHVVRQRSPPAYPPYTHAQPRVTITAPCPLSPPPPPPLFLCLSLPLYVSPYPSMSLSRARTRVRTRARPPARPPARARGGSNNRSWCMHHYLCDLGYLRCACFAIFESEGTLRDNIIYPDSHDDMLRKGMTDEHLMDIVGCVPAHAPSGCVVLPRPAGNSWWTHVNPFQHCIQNALCWRPPICQFRHVSLQSVVEREGGLDSINDWTDVLSGGERQRVAMARLFYNNAKCAALAALVFQSQSKVRAAPLAPSSLAAALCRSHHACPCLRPRVDTQFWTSAHLLSQSMWRARCTTGARKWACR